MGVCHLWKWVYIKEVWPHTLLLTAGLCWATISLERLQKRHYSCQVGHDFLSSAFLLCCLSLVLVPELSSQNSIMLLSTCQSMTLITLLIDFLTPRVHLSVSLTSHLRPFSELGKPSLLDFHFFKIMCMSFACLYVCAPHVCSIWGGRERAVPRTGVTDGY